MSYLKSIGTAVIYIGVFLAVITFMPGLPPDTEFQEFSVTPPRKFDPKVGPKNRLNNAEKLFDGEINGPEGFDSYDGQLYTGVHGGYILRIEEDRLVSIVKFGKKCEGIWQEHKCGRPLGMKFDKKGNLYVVDTYYGIFKVNVTTKNYENIVNISKPIDGKISRIPNSIDIAKNGDLYWTVSSTDFALYDIVQSFLANPSGRLIRYNVVEKKNEVLMRNLAFANGIMLSDDESFVIVAETQANRIMKYNLKGPKAGQQEIFIDGLPGLPDNIHSDGQGGFLVTLIITVDSEHPQLFQSLAPHPYIRKMLVRLLLTMELPFKLLHDIYPNIFTERLLHAIGSFHGLGSLIQAKDQSLLLRIDAAGNIVEILSSEDDTISHMSAAHIHNGFLWFGSPWNKYLTRVPLKQAFPDLANSEKQFSHSKSEKLPNVDVKTEKVKRDTDSMTPKSTAAPTTPKLTAAPTTTPKPTAAPTTPKPTATPTTSKSTAAPKSSSKADKPINNNAKPSETKSSAEVKKDNAKTASNAKSKSPNVKSEEDIQSKKNVKVEQDASKQKAQKSHSEKVNRVETSRPKSDL